MKLSVMLSVFVAQPCFLETCGILS